MTHTTIRMLAALPALVLLASCLPKVDDDESGCGPFSNCGSYGYRYGTGWYWETGYWEGSYDDDPDVGDLQGTAGVYIVEAACDVIWDISGPQCSGCDLGWDVDLDATSAGSCSSPSDVSGTFEVVSGAAYFKGDYWGAASAGGGAVTWATAGYVYGGAGYTYAYAGSGTY